MTPDQIQSTRELLAALPEDERPMLARAAADSLGVCPAALVDEVGQIVRRFLA